MEKIFNNVLFQIFLSLILACLTQAQFLTPKFDEITIAIPNYVLQDRNGFIWIGSQEGLIRYDGNELKKYQNIPFDSTSISGDWVFTISEDENGNLWVATMNGLNYFNQITEQFTLINVEDKNDSSIKSKAINKMIGNDDGSMWIATIDCGVFFMKIDKKGKPVFNHYKLTNGIKLKDSNEKLEVWDLYKDAEDLLWIATLNGGLLKLNTETGDVTQFINNPDDPTSLSHNTVRLICPDYYGNLWIGTSSEFIGSGGGLNMLNPRTGKFTHFRHNPADSTSLPSDWVYPLFIDSKGIFWINFFNGDLISIPLSELLNNNRPDFSKCQRYELSGEIQTIYEDRLGNIWFSPFSWGLYKYDPNQNPFYWYHKDEKRKNTMSVSGVQCIYIDHLQNIWFGHGTSVIDKYNPSTGNYKNYNLQLLDPGADKEIRVMSLCEDMNGFLWIATFNNGLYKMHIESEKFKKIYSPPVESYKIENTSIWYMITSKTGNLWLGPIGKDLILFDTETYHSKIIELDPAAGEGARISTMIEDKDGNLWIGTFNSGLYKIQLINNEVKIISHFLYNQRNKNSLSYNSICDIVQPSVVDTNALWIGTACGINRLDIKTNSFTHFFEKDGIPDKYVLQVLEDNQGNIWMTGKIGIGVYDIRTKKWKSYGSSDGLPFERFGGMRQNNVKAPDGQLFFSGGSGTIGFYPEEIQKYPISPPVRFIDFKVFDKSVKLDTSIVLKKTIILSYNQNVFSFEIVALSYTNQEKNRYTYKMEGYNNDWVYLGNENTVSFTNLEPGKYILNVKASITPGVWGKDATSISIIITPPWWATWWFRTIVILAVIGIGYSIYRYRINKVREMERLRVQIASDLHDDIGSALTRIAVHSEIIQTTTEKEKVSSASKRIGNMSREIITTLSDVVWSIDSRNDTVGDLIDRMRDFLDTVFPAGSIHIGFQTKGLHFDQKIEQSLRQNIYLIFKEAVNNAAKHSGADEIKISMINGDGKFKMEIADNGTGITEEMIHTGHHGLDNMKLRAERISGELNIKNLGKGTSVTLIAKNI